MRNAQTINDKTIAVRLTEKARELGSQSELARRLGVKRPQLDTWLSGVTPEPAVNIEGIWQLRPIVARLADVLELTEDEVLALMLLGRGLSSKQLKAIGNLNTLAFPIPVGAGAVSMRPAA